MIRCIDLVEEKRKLDLLYSTRDLTWRQHEIINFKIKELEDLLGVK